ncbi:MAG: hypothetical protein GXO77_02090 [Calditrichaeota bacterium]|nr:hypothetical protein [Calditrichota bacterium]
MRGLKIILFFVLIIFLQSLTCQQQNDRYETRLVYRVDSVKVLQNNQKTVTLRIIATVPTPCYEFDYFRTQFRRDTVDIYVYARTDRETICVQVLGAIKHQITIAFPKAGNYVLHFAGRSKDVYFPLGVD